MFVSTRTATGIELLTRPAPGDRMRNGLEALLSLQLPLPRIIEEGQLLGFRQGRLLTPDVHTDPVPGGLPLDLVAGADPVLVGERLGKRDLELARDLRHVLTLARTK